MGERFATDFDIETGVNRKETPIIQPVTDGLFDQAAYVEALEQGKAPITARRAGINAGSVTMAAIVTVEGVQNA
ncbi:MAG: hypothetical protein JWO47_682 [Candidatus Saccharibacteria bacterium]|nr:hypothetical protein [Candidatus Saccharibacteria bacterium]